ncbi:immunity protein BlpZ [Streptococcus pneumoniae]
MKIKEQTRKLAAGCLALMAIFIGAGYVVGFWLLKWFVLERLELKDDA